MIKILFQNLLLYKTIIIIIIFHLIKNIIFVSLYIYNRWTKFPRQFIHLKKKKGIKELTILIQTNHLHALSSRNRVEKRKREERERENEQSNSA